MEFEQAVRRRRMVRSYTREPVAPAVIDEICDLARRAPTAGNTAGIEFLVLEGDATDRYWDVTLPPDRREDFAWPGLLAAPVLVVVWAHLGGYLSRYREPDKRRTGLGGSASAWPVPYWYVDGGAAVMTMLLAARDRGLGAAFFGMFEHERAVRRPLRRAAGPAGGGHRRHRTSCHRRPPQPLGRAGPTRPRRGDPPGLLVALCRRHRC